jgi:predicted transcriptional regulator
MARPMPQVDAGVLLEEVYRILLAGNPAVMVLREGRLADLITRSDLMEYYERLRKTASLPQQAL